MARKLFTEVAAVSAVESTVQVPNCPQLNLQNVGAVDFQYDFDQAIDSESPILFVGSAIQLDGMGGSVLHLKTAAGVSTCQIVGVRTFKV